MGLFSRNDWSVIAIIFERRGLYQVNGNRAKGSAAKKTRDGAKRHKRTIFWAVFDQNRSLVDSGPGPAAGDVGKDAVKNLERELHSNHSIQSVLKSLETGEQQQLARPLEWAGYPRD